MLSLRKRLKQKLNNYIEKQVNDRLSYLVPQLVEYNSSSGEMCQSHHDHTKDPLGNYQLFLSLKERLTQKSVVVEESTIDIEDFKKWLQNNPELSAVYKRWGDVYIEKCLEHYLSYKYLDLNEDDIFIDVAASTSPYADLLRTQKKIKSYRLDLVYPDGINGYDIGADASNTGLPESFASSLAVHCAFEMFMGDADINFAKEASRILDNEGRFVILPLYLDDSYFIATSPYCNQDEINFDKGAIKVWRDDKYKIPFSRQYSPEAFSERIFNSIPKDMEGKVYFFSNIPELMKEFQDQRIYCFYMLYVKKMSS
jgi:hypothetical protein